MEVEQVCRRLLDNSNLEIDLSEFPKITLTFAVIGAVDSKYWEVIFVLDCVFDLQIEREYDGISSPNEAYMVLEASVNEFKYQGNIAHEITIGHGGDLDLSAKTIGFNWVANSFNEQEFKIKYSYFFAGKNA